MPRVPNHMGKNKLSTVNVEPPRIGFNLDSAHMRCEDRIDDIQRKINPVLAAVVSEVRPSTPFGLLHI
jgi:hypothetical protein